MSNNTNLGVSKMTKNDEFYTKIKDIDNEIQYYKKHLKDKIIYCNCDHPQASNFSKYFMDNFSILGLKKLITTCYENESKALMSVTSDGIHKFVTELDGDGSFDSEECVSLLRESDIVITNPPFSKFTTFIKTIINNNKSFLVIGNQNNITYKDIWPLIKDNKIWLGITKPKEFIQPDGSTKKFGNTCWYTNLDTPKRHENILLNKSYNPDIYPTYDNYDGINVDRIKDIPYDYTGVIGVPITFLYKYNPDQFEIVGLGRYLDVTLSKQFVDDYLAAGNKAHIHPGHPDLCFYKKDGTPVLPYMRLLIKRKIYI